LPILQVFTKDADKDTVILLGARASRVENQDAIDACIVGMLGDPREVCNFIIKKIKIIYIYIYIQYLTCCKWMNAVFASYKIFSPLFAGKRWYQRDTFLTLQSSGQAYCHNIYR